MTNETKDETLQKSEEKQSSDEQQIAESLHIDEPVSKGTEGDVIDLTDDREYPNQLNMLRDISHIYQHLTPANKKIVRLSIARASKE